MANILHGPSACKNYYCTHWDSDENGGHCMLYHHTDDDCQLYTVLNSTDELTRGIDDFDDDFDDDFELDLDALENPLPFKIDYDYQFPDCNDPRKIISIIQDGLANGFTFEIKGGRILVKEVNR